LKLENTTLPEQAIISKTNNHFKLILASVKILRKLLETNQNKIVDLINRYHADGYIISINGMESKNCYCTNEDEISFRDMDSIRRYCKFWDIESIEINAKRE